MVRRLLGAVIGAKVAQRASHISAPIGAMLGSTAVAASRKLSPKSLTFILAGGALLTSGLRELRGADMKS